MQLTLFLFKQMQLYFSKISKNFFEINVSEALIRAPLIGTMFYYIQKSR